MNKKRYQGPSNDKERSKQRLVAAVGQVIQSKGYTGLTATNIAREADLDRRMISLYFGTLDNLIETYVRDKDYWLAASGDAVGMIQESTGDNTREILETLLLHQLDYFYANEEMQKIIIWQISESTKLMKDICDERELLSKEFFTLSDKELGSEDVDLRAVSALLVAGIYYMVLHAKSTNSLFCEIDINTAEGLDRIKCAIRNILKQTYKA